MTDASEWQGKVGESWAAEWKRTDRGFGGLTEKLLARSRDFSFHHALDIGCGAGELSLALARGRPHCTVTGVDISPQLLTAALERGTHLANVRFELGDAAVWRPKAGDVPELLISRHGVMFFDDPSAAFANLADLAADDASLLFSCFRDWSENPFFTEVAALLPGPQNPPPLDAPGPFAFSDKDRTAAILTGGGWRDIGFERFDFAMVAGVGADPVEDAMTYFATIGPAAAAAREMSPDDRAAFFDRVRHMAQSHLATGIVALRASCWIVTARKAK